MKKTERISQWTKLKKEKMKNLIKVLALSFFAIGMMVFTSCGSDDNMPDNDPVIICDSLNAQINIDYDTLDNALVTVLSVETYGYTGPFVYTWSTGETTETITLNADDDGTYSVTVTADGLPDCEAVGTIDLSGDNTTDCSSLVSEILMYNDSSNVTILSANVSGGTPAYSYLWSTGETDSAIEITDEGTYGVSITDSEGCIIWTTYTYENNGNSLCDDFIGDISTSNDSAGVVVLTANVSGGTGPYLYYWSNGSLNFSSNSISVSVSGTYSVNVEDANGCIITLSETVTVNGNNPCDNFAVNIFYQPDSLNMGQDYLFGNVNGGSAPYTYLWSTGEVGSTIDVTNTTGSFSITATDANGCVADDTIQL